MNIYEIKYSLRCGYFIKGDFSKLIGIICFIDNSINASIIMRKLMSIYHYQTSQLVKDKKKINNKIVICFL